MVTSRDKMIEDNIGLVHSKLCNNNICVLKVEV